MTAFLRLLKTMPVALKFCLALSGSAAVFFILAVSINSYDATATDFLNRLQTPSLEHWFGTDEYGRDVLTRVLSGTLTSLSLSLYATVLALLLGAMVGLLMGFKGGWTDRVGTVWVDTIMAFPGLLLVLGLMAVIGPSRLGIILALGLSYFPAIARVVRTRVISLRGQDFVIASVLLGASDRYILRRHILPNCTSVLTVMGTTVFTSCLLSETALSFLGLGVPPPAPSWGGMLADGRLYLDLSVYLVVFPGLAICLTLLIFNLLGDALRDYWESRNA